MTDIASRPISNISIGELIDPLAAFAPREPEAKLFRIRRAHTEDRLRGRTGGKVGSAPMVRPAVILICQAFIDKKLIFSARNQRTINIRYIVNPGEAAQ